jgi:ribosome recycling factor
VPPLTEERRRDLVKKAKTELENAKVTIRNVRRAGMDAGKKLEKEGVPEDEVKLLEKEMQTLTDTYSEKADKLFELKEKDIMTV